MTKNNPTGFYNKSSYFDKGAKVFSDLNSPFQKYRIQKVLEIYTPRKDEVVLDLGCGWGTFCFALAPYCKDITGLDFSQKAIDFCVEHLKNSPYKNIKFICADAQDTGLASGGYDVIIGADLFEHLYPDAYERVLDECKRLLKPLGKLLIWTPHRGHYLEILKNHNMILKKDPSHVDYKSMERLLVDLRQGSFKILKAYYTESHIRGLQLIEKLLLSFVPIMRRRIAILAEK